MIKNNELKFSQNFDNKVVKAFQKNILSNHFSANCINKSV